MPLFEWIPASKSVCLKKCESLSIVTLTVRNSSVSSIHCSCGAGGIKFANKNYSIQAKRSLGHPLSLTSCAWEKWLKRLSESHRICHFYVAMVKGTSSSGNWLANHGSWGIGVFTLKVIEGSYYNLRVRIPQGHIWKWPLLHNCVS